MKILGLEKTKEPLKFTVLGVTKDDGSALTLVVDPLPFGWEERFFNEVPEPQPPSKVIGVGKKGPIIRDQERDPVYRQKLATFARRMASFAIFHALAKDPQVTWETDPELRKKDAPAFWHAISVEIEKTGWPGPEVTRLFDFIRGESDPKEGKIEEDAELFPQTAVRTPAS